MSRLKSKEPDSYHHGDLRRALVDAAVEEIADKGPGGVSLRELARRLGVSHAAPVHHFGDKAGLLTAVAAEGFRLLADSLAEAWEETESFLEVGVAYVRFALSHRAHFEVMFRPDLYREEDSEVAEARAKSASVLYGRVRSAAGGKEADAQKAGVAAWSLVHGLATLWLSGNLPSDLGDDHEEAAREIASYLFPTRSRRRVSRSTRRLSP